MQVADMVTCVFFFKLIKSGADRQQSQHDLHKMTEWSEKWQMLFNFEKWQFLHTGYENEDAQYTMGGTVLNKRQHFHWDKPSVDHRRPGVTVGRISIGKASSIGMGTSYM